MKIRILSYTEPVLDELAEADSRGNWYRVKNNCGCTLEYNGEQRIIEVPANFRLVGAVRLWQHASTLACVVHAYMYRTGGWSFYEKVSKEVADAVAVALVRKQRGRLRACLARLEMVLLGRGLRRGWQAAVAQLLTEDLDRLVGANSTDYEDTYSDELHTPDGEPSVEDARRDDPEQSEDGSYSTETESEDQKEKQAEESKD